jgi:peptide/nickel transport system substrate-binding protein
VYTGSRWPYLGTLIVGAGLLALLWLLAAAGYAGTSRGRTYVEAIVGQAGRINPLLSAQNDADSDIAALVFSGLTRIDGDGEVLPDLAESWETAADGRTHTFYLRRDLYWQDGRRLRADDVVFTLDLLRQAAAADEPGIPTFWREVEATSDGDYTVILSLQSPFAQLPSYAHVGVLPRHLLEGTTFASLKAAPFNQAPVGAGPYALVQLDAAHAVLQPHYRYWAGRPGFDRIEFRFYPNADAQLTALQRHEAHAGFIVGKTPAEVRNALTADTSLTVLTMPRNETGLIYFNTAVSQLADIDVRQALASAIDREHVTSLGETGVIAAAEFGAPGFWTAAGEVRRADVAKAQALLDAAGWPADESGRRSKDGQPLRIVLTTTSEKDGAARGQAIVERWRSIGVDARLEPLSTALIVREAIAPRRFDAILLSRVDSVEPDLYANWHSSQTGPDARNIANLSDSGIDALAEEARRQPDVEQRLAIYRRAAQLLQRNAPAVPLFHPVDVFVIDRRIAGVSPGNLYSNSSRFAGIAQWRFQRDRR